MDVPVTIALEGAIAKQNAAFSVIKQQSEQDQLLAGILEKSVKSAPVSGLRGANVNITA